MNGMRAVWDWSLAAPSSPNKEELISTWTSGAI